MTAVSVLTLLLVQQSYSVKLVKAVAGVRPVAFAAAPSGSKVAMCLEDRSVRIVDAKTRGTVRTLSGHPQAAYAAAWSPNGRLIATGDESGRIFFWNAVSGAKIREVRTHTRGVQFLAFNRTSTRLVSTGKDDTMRFYDAASGKELKVIFGKGANFYGARYIPGSESVVVGTLGQGTHIYSNYAKVKSYGGHSDKAVWDVDARAGRIVTAGRDAMALIWGSSPAKPAAKLMGHADWVVRSLFSPNGRLLATSSTDSTVKLWDMRGFKLVQTISAQSMVGAPLCFTADGRFLLTAGNDDFLQVHSVAPAAK
jgi:WD40 repeat protein